jgi:hypothetical protein
MMLNRIVAMAWLIIIDGVRRRAIFGLLLFAFASIISGLLFYQFIPRDIGRTSCDFLLSISWVTGTIFLLSHTVEVFAWNNERGPLHTYLARPISRTEYALGLFVGMSVLLLVLHFMLGSLNWVILNSIQRSVDEVQFQPPSLSYFILAGIGVYCIHIIYLAVILLFSSSIRGSFPVLLLTLCYYFICSGLPVVRESLKEQNIENTNKYLSSMLKWLTALFPDSSSLDFKTIIATTDVPPATMQIIYSFGQSFLYIIVLVWLACVVYEKRDLQ